MINNKIPPNVPYGVIKNPLTAADEAEIKTGFVSKSVEYDSTAGDVPLYSNLSTIKKLPDSVLPEKEFNKFTIEDFDNDEHLQHTSLLHDRAAENTSGDPENVHALDMSYIDFVGNNPTNYLDRTLTTKLIQYGLNSGYSISSIYGTTGNENDLVNPEKWDDAAPQLFYATGNDGRNPEGYVIFDGYSTNRQAVSGAFGGPQSSGVGIAVKYDVEAATEGSFESVVQKLYNFLKGLPSDGVALGKVISAINAAYPGSAVSAELLKDQDSLEEFIDLKQPRTNVGVREFVKDVNEKLEQDHPLQDYYGEKVDQYVMDSYSSTNGPEFLAPRYTGLFGTSFASPILAGFWDTLLEKYGNYLPEDVIMNTLRLAANREVYVRQSLTSQKQSGYEAFKPGATPQPGELVSGEEAGKPGADPLHRFYKLDFEANSAGFRLDDDNSAGFGMIDDNVVAKADAVLKQLVAYRFHGLPEATPDASDNNYIETPQTVEFNISGPGERVTLNAGDYYAYKVKVPAQLDELVLDKLTFFSRDFVAPNFPYSDPNALATPHYDLRNMYIESYSDGKLIDKAQIEYGHSIIDRNADTKPNATMGHTHEFTGTDMPDEFVVYLPYDIGKDGKAKLYAWDTHSQSKITEVTKKLLSGEYKGYDEAQLNEKLTDIAQNKPKFTDEEFMDINRNGIKFEVNSNGEFITPEKEEPSLAPASVTDSPISEPEFILL